jgi:hypothetical protein
MEGESLVHTIRVNERKPYVKVKMKIFNITRECVNDIYIDDIPYLLHIISTKMKSNAHNQLVKNNNENQLSILENINMYQ